MGAEFIQPFAYFFHNNGSIALPAQSHRAGGGVDSELLKSRRVMASRHIALYHIGIVLSDLFFRPKKIFGEKNFFPAKFGPAKKSPSHRKGTPEVSPPPARSQITPRRGQ
jgi:hypothetical protein